MSMSFLVLILDRKSIASEPISCETQALVSSQEMAEIKATRKYEIRVPIGCEYESHAVRLISETYKLSGSVKFVSSDSASPATKISINERVLGDQDSLAAESEMFGLEEILSVLTQGYKATSTAPGRKKRLIEEHPWYFSGYRATRQRVRTQGRFAQRRH